MGLQFSSYSVKYSTSCLNKRILDAFKTKETKRQNILHRLALQKMFIQVTLKDIWLEKTSGEHIYHISLMLVKFNNDCQDEKSWRFEKHSKGDYHVLLGKVSDVQFF